MTKLVEKKSGFNKNYWIVGIAISLYGLRKGLDYVLEAKLAGRTVYEKEHPYFEIPDFMNNEEIETLKEFVFEKRRFVTGKDAFNVGVEDIGEAVPVDKDGNPTSVGWMPSYEGEDPPF